MPRAIWPLVLIAGPLIIAGILFLTADGGIGYARFHSSDTADGLKLTAAACCVLAAWMSVERTFFNALSSKSSGQSAPAD